MERNNKIPPPALTSITVVRAGITALTAHPPGKQVKHIEKLRLPGGEVWWSNAAGARSTTAFFAILRLHVTGAPSHLPQVDGQEVPQPSQVLWHLSSKVTGSCKWSLKTISFILYETQPIQRGSGYMKNNPCSYRNSEQSSQLWLELSWS